MRDTYITIYMDDILIHTLNNLILHCRVVNDVLRILVDNDLYLKPQKCQLKVTKVEYLGMIMHEDSITMDPVKVQGIKNWKQPMTLKKVWAFFSFLNFYQMYIWGFSILAAPLNALVAHCVKGGKFYWNNKHKTAFRALIDAVYTTPILCQPQFEDQFIVDCDASTFTIGTILQQRDEKDKLHPVAFLLWTLNTTQWNWDIYDKELFAVVHALATWQLYLIGNMHWTIVNTNHNNLTYFKAARKLNWKQVHWMQELVKYDFELQHISGKHHIPADFLSWPFGVDQGKDNNEEMVLLPPARFAQV